jgi:hypothetical protein
MDIEEYLSKVNRDGLYYSPFHEGIGHFVYDLENRGMPRTLLGFYFKIIIFQKTKTVVELTGIEPLTHEIITNVAFEDGDYKGSAFL